MIDIILSGCNGKMGRVVSQLALSRTDCKIAAGVDFYAESSFEYKIFQSFEELPQLSAVIIDFSSPTALDGLLAYAVKYRLPCVLCATGYSEQQVEKIHNAAEKTAVFYSGNMSLGINLLIALSKQAAKILGGGFDIEIIEKHHNQKIDAPSGTALMIADGISSVLHEEPQYIYDRHSIRKKRSRSEIGIHSVRAGTIVGEHEVIFAGHDEVISLKHQAQSKEVFAVGALNAAVFMSGKTQGLFDMGSMID